METPTTGDPLGKSCYKVRIGITSKGKGKRGGGRVITYVRILAGEVVLLSIYDKAIKPDLKPGELDDLLEQLE